MVFCARTNPAGDDKSSGVIAAPKPDEHGTLANAFQIFNIRTRP